MNDNCSWFLKIILDNVHEAVLVTTDVDAWDGVCPSVSPEDSVMDPVHCHTIRGDHYVRYKLSVICPIEINTETEVLKRQKLFQIFHLYIFWVMMSV